MSLRAGADGVDAADWGEGVGQDDHHNCSLTQGAWRQVRVEAQVVSPSSEER